MPGNVNPVYSRKLSEKERQEMFRPTFFSWRADKFDSYSQFMLSSAKSALVGGLEGCLLGVVADLALIASGNEKAQEFVLNNVYLIPEILGMAGFLYGALKRQVYGVEKPKLKFRRAQTHTHIPA